MVQAWQTAADNYAAMLLRPLLPAFTALTIACASLTLAAGADPAPLPTPPSPIKLTHCSILKPRPLSKRATGTQIAFVNAGPTLIHHITFEVGYRSHGLDYGRSVEDDGIFAPNTPVDHRYALYSDVGYAGSTPLYCRVTTAH